MENTNLKNIAVLVSGTGSILEAMLAEGIPIALVVADRECRGLDIARQAGVPTELIRRAEYLSAGVHAQAGGTPLNRDAYTAALVETLAAHRIGLIAMAGFMTILSPSIFNTYRNRILNTHPSLLPAFKGDRAVADALAAGTTETGCTIHIATEELDDGPVLVQEKVPVMPGDTVETLHERIKAVERALYPKLLKAILAGGIALPEA
jgi:phosphoribosylglycinamide formyltransferase 1